MAENSEFTGNILVRAIIEMLGAPKEHIEKTLKDYIEKLKSESKFRIVKADIEPAKEQGKLFATFAELEIRFNAVQDIIDFCFDSMPSSVEIVEPMELKIDAAKLSDTLNDLQAKLHRNDLIVKTLKAKGTVLDKNAKNLLRNFVFFIIKEKPQTAEDISKTVGVKVEQISPFLKELSKEGKITEKEGKYGRTEQGTKEKA